MSRLTARRGGARSVAGTLVASVAAVAIAGAAGCGSGATSDATSVVISVDSDLAGGTAFDEIAILVTNARGEKQFTFPIRSRGDLPAVLGLLPAGDRAEPFEVTATARLSAADVVAQSVRAEFVPGRASLIAMTLTGACVGMTCASADETCDEGQCRSRRRMSVPWDGGAPAGSGGAGRGGSGGAGGVAAGTGGAGDATGGAGGTSGTGGAIGSGGAAAGGAPGSGGGAMATGGAGAVPGSGGAAGAIGTGGRAAGTGGAVGTGGNANGSGGSTPGTGGAPGTGGVQGTGGAPGTGGSGTGGAPNCNDGNKNGTETDTDCGGMCLPAKTCADGNACGSDGANCASGVCGGGICRAPTCTDAVRNGNESDQDCGGGNCPMCAIGKVCRLDGDCVSGYCQGLMCRAAPPNAHVLSHNLSPDPQWSYQTIEIQNMGSTAITLPQLRIRYWFDSDGRVTATPPMCLFAATVGCGAITLQVVTVNPVRTGATHYLEIGFTPTAASLAAGAGTGEIQTGFHYTLFEAVNRNNDYSFNASTTRIDWTKITLYQNGNLIWGTEPPP